MRGKASIPIPAVLAATLVLPGLAAAQEPAPPSRYSITPSNGGFVRLDTETGAVSHCLKRDGAWLCDPAEESPRTTAKIVEIQAAIAELSRRLDTLQGVVTELGKEVETIAVGRFEAPADVGDAAKKAPPSSGTASDHVNRPDLAARLIEPLIGMVANLKRGLAAGE